MGGRYVLQIVPAARKSLLRIPEPHRQRIRLAVRGLAVDARPPGSMLLAGGQRTWRIRIGDYRIIYEIHDERLLVLVIRLGHRGQIYRMR